MRRTLTLDVVLWGFWVLCAFESPARTAAQDTPPPRVTRLAILMAEDRRAPTLRDLATIRAGTRSLDPETCLLYTSPSPRDRQKSRMPSSA